MYNHRIVLFQAFALNSWAQTQPDCDYVNLNLAFDPTWLASDKFHPGPPIYQLWGSTVATQISQWAAAQTSL